MIAWVYDRRIYLDRTSLAAGEDLQLQGIEDCCEPIELPTPPPTGAFLVWTDRGYQLIDDFWAARAASRDGEVVCVGRLPDGCYTGRPEDGRRSFAPSSVLA